MDCIRRTPAVWPWPCVDGEPVRPCDTLWDVDGKRVEVGSVRFDREGAVVEVRRPAPDAPDGYYVTLVDADEEAFKRLTRTKRDGWGRLKKDSEKDAEHYWGCAGHSLCRDCPATVDGKKPWERFGTQTCGLAQCRDIFRRAKALAGVS